MGKPYFKFKQFAIRQDKTAMKVGTDGVLLGAWFNVPQRGRVLDIGTGTGLIALMSAQRSGSIIIDAVEIDTLAAEQASENIEASPYSSRINIHNVSIQDFSVPYKFDSIVCNPPFFTESITAPNPMRRIARHCTTLTHNEIVQLAATKFLDSEYGTISLILPPDAATALIEDAKKFNLHLQCALNVFPNPGKPQSRTLFTLGFNQEVKPKVSNLVLEIEHHNLTEEHKALVKDFYLFL